jgi:hypothetical protein
MNRTPTKDASLIIDEQSPDTLAAKKQLVATSNVQRPKHTSEYFTIDPVAKKMK